MQIQLHTGAPLLNSPDITYTLYRTVKNIGGFIGLLVLSPIIMLLLGVLFVFAYLGRMYIVRQLNKLVKCFDSLSDREKMDVHLETERLLKIFKNKLSQTEERSVFLTQPYFRQINILGTKLENCEARFRKSVYPDLNEPLKESIKAKLIDSQKFQGQDDWTSADSDLYAKAYC